VTPTPNNLDRISPQARHYLLVLVVFALTGSIAVFLSRLVLSNLLGLDGSLW